MLKRIAIAAVLVALLSMPACGGDEDPPPEALKRPKVDPERTAPAWVVIQAAREAEDERDGALSKEQQRLTRELRDARGEAAVRQILGDLRSAWRDRDPAGYGYLTSHALVWLNGRHRWRGHAESNIQREIAFDTLALEDALRPDIEADLAAMLSSGLYGLPRERVAEFRARVARHWVRAWSRLEDAVDDGVRQGLAYNHPGPGEDIAWSGGAPPYLLDAGARAAYDEKLGRWIEATSHHHEQVYLKRSLKRHRMMLRLDLVRAYRLEPHDHSGLRKLLSGSSIPAEDQSSILLDVGAQE